MVRLYSALRSQVILVQSPEFGVSEFKLQLAPAAFSNLKVEL
jgi:hypothetical protein